MPTGNKLSDANLRRGGQPGRPKGSQNKTTKLLKDAILKAAEATGEDQQGKAGLVGYCTFLAKDEPKAFAQLLGKVLPIQVQGDPDAPITGKVTLTIVDSRK